MCIRMFTCMSMCIYMYALPLGFLDCLSVRVALRSASSASARGCDVATVDVHIMKMIFVLQRENGHRLVVFYPTGRPPALACTRCGAWAASAPKKLLSPCVRSEEPRPAMDRLAAGRHPGDGTLLEAAYHIIAGQPQGAAVQLRN